MVKTYRSHGWIALAGLGMAALLLFGVVQANNADQTKAGKTLFEEQCLKCHSMDGGDNDIRPLVRHFTYLGMIAQLTGQGKTADYMPMFEGSEADKEALAAYITTEINKKPIVTEPSAFEPKDIPIDIPPFDPKTAEYVILAWNDLGMHCISDGDAWFMFLPPANTLEAQVIKRGEQPEIVTEGIELHYQVEPGYEHPWQHVQFWDYARTVFGADLKIGIGLFGKGVNGTFNVDEEKRSFIAPGVPVVPYPDDGSYNPYPIFTVEAKDPATGKTLATTKMVAPVSTEVGCRNCHDGDWRVLDMAGLSDETAQNILASHDRRHKTNLLGEAKEGQPKLCQGCHADPALGAPGQETVLNFSTAMHGWHANYMPYQDARACEMCHPAFQRGSTRCMRDLHHGVGITCVDCHGTLQEHAASLLQREIAKPAAPALLANLKTTVVTSTAEVNPRTPWVQEPDCVNCHKGFEKPAANPSGFNVWNEEMAQLYRMRADNAGVRCIGCHGATHSVYPATNPFGKNRDNMQPMQYSGHPFPIGSNQSCVICHTIPMDDAIHHENMEHSFRNTQIVK